MPLEDRTEAPTPRRRREARQRGQVARSAEVNSAIVLLVALMAIRFAGPIMLTRLGGVANECLSSFPKTDLTIASVRGGLVRILLDMSVILGPLLAAVFVAGLVSSAMQVGLVFSWEPLAPKPSRFDVIAGIARMFSARSAVELGKAVAKVSIVSYMVFACVRGEYPMIIGLTGCDAKVIAAAIGGLMYRLLFRAGLVMLVIAAIDYGFQRRQNEKSLKMTKQEVKEDYKRSEGDPLIRSQIRRRQRQLMKNRMMAQVPKADVVITNPTHFAVALKYDSDEMTAPVVLAKGQRLVAQKIKEIARENDVPMVENVQLARALYKSTEVGDEIPAVLYQAVAEILAYVYKLNNELAA